MRTALLRVGCSLLLLSMFQCPAVSAGEWIYRLYGYTPRVYGYAPSAYVFPRYGLHRGYVYFEGPPYGSPAFDDPNHHPCPRPIPMPEEYLSPAEEFDLAPVQSAPQASRVSSRRVK